MAKNKSVPLYKGTHSQMCAAITLAWQNYSKYQPDFAQKNTRYTPALATEQLDAIKAAEEMPKIYQRLAIPKEARIKLHNAALHFAGEWQTLSSLIEHSFEEDRWETMKSLAGSSYYRNATHRQWVEVVNLIKAATSFVSDREEILTAGGMNATFPRSSPTRLRLI